MDSNTSDGLRQRIALAVGAHRNGLASDGQGWFRDDADMAECYALAEALLPLFAAERQAAYQDGEAQSPDESVQINGVRYRDAAAARAAGAFSNCASKDGAR